MSSKRFAFLDGIRGIAAVFVVMHHMPELWPFTLGHAYLAVDLFFLLSGFVIGFAYDTRLQTGTLTPASFMKVRAIRLYPMYLFALVLCTLPLFFGFFPEFAWVAQRPEPAGPAVTILFAALVLPLPIRGVYMLFPLNGPTWSLFFEAITNMVYALSRRYLTGKTVAGVVGASAIGVVLIVEHYGNIDAGWHWGDHSPLAGLIRSVFGIFAGLGMYFLYPVISSKFASFKTAPWVGIFLITLVLALPSLGTLDSVIDALAVLCIFPIAVAFCAVGTNSAFSNALIALGNASYPIYVLHYPLNEMLKHWIPRARLAGGWISGLLFVIALFALAMLVERLYDIPVRRRLSAIGKRKEKTPAEMAL